MYKYLALAYDSKYPVSIKTNSSQMLINVTSVKYVTISPSLLFPAGHNSTGGIFIKAFRGDTYSQFIHL